MTRRAFRSPRIVTPHGVVDGALLVDRDGKIEAIVPEPQLPDSLPGDRPIVDLGDDALLPGAVDTHVHANDPGRTQWEGFRTATLGAAAGGVTTIVDMPLNSIPATTTAEALHAKRDAVLGEALVDYAFWGGAIAGNAGDLGALLDAGARGLKCFLADSGVQEFPRVDEDDLRAAARTLAERGLPLLVHAELTDDRIPEGDPRAYSTWLESRPPEYEHRAIRLAIRVAMEQGCALHIVHLASADGVDLVEDARRDMQITVETCPHYLNFAAEEIPDGATIYKCAPPIRTADHRARLVRAVVDGTIDLVASDHSPCPPELKLLESGDILLAWGGISSLQLLLPATWTALSQAGGSLPRLARLTSDQPARLAGLLDVKGALEPGLDADLVVFDPDATYTVEPTMVLHRHSITPYSGHTLRGRVRSTWLRGVRICDETGPLGAPIGEEV